MAISAKIVQRLPAYLALAFLVFACQARADPIRIVALGTSFTAGKGVWTSEAFPARLESMLKSAGEDVQIRNQGKNGDSTQNLLDRLDDAVPEKTDAVILEYARGNDSRAGISPKETVKNVDAIVSRLTARRIPVLLVIRGRNAGQLQRHIEWFGETVAKYGITYAGINQPKSSLLPDGQHPTAEAHGQIAASLVSPVRKLIEQVRAQRSQGPAVK